MKVLLFIIFMFIIAFQSNANWEFISKDSKNSSIYIDIKSIKVFKNLIYA
mgnify:FL=1